jgi:hypothetical protein
MFMILQLYVLNASGRLPILIKYFVGEFAKLDSKPSALSIVIIKSFMGQVK